MATMKCAVYHGKCDIRIEEREIPAPGPDEVLVKIMACGVCGTDVHIYNGEPGSTQTVIPLIPGHEFCGIITGRGERVTELKVGDRVIVDPADNCGDCYYCNAGKPAHCEKMRAIGTNADGGFAQYGVFHKRLIHHMADDVSFIEGAMAEPLGCCINGADRGGVKISDTVLIYGAGPIGLIHVELALLKGASRVIVVEPVEGKREMATKLGAAFTIDPVKECVPEVLKARGVEHVDVVIECCGRMDTSAQAVDIVDKQGIVVYFAVPPADGIYKLKAYPIYQKELTIIASYCSPYDMERAAQMLNTHRIDVTSMLAGTKPLEGLADILSDPNERAKGKWIILPNGPEEKPA